MKTLEDKLIELAIFTLEVKNDRFKFREIACYISDIVYGNNDKYTKILKSLIEKDFNIED